MINSKIQETLDLANKFGLNVLPVGDDKRPYYSLLPKIFDKAKNKWKHSWEYLQYTKATQEEINKWFGNGSNANIGIIGGNISNNLYIIDVDNMDLAQHLLSKFPQTRNVQSKKGYHFYFFSKINIPCFPIDLTNDNNDEIRIDIKSEGGYCVAPKSLHPEGITYKFINQNDIPYLDFFTALNIIYSNIKYLDIKPKNEKFTKEYIIKKHFMIENKIEPNKPKEFINDKTIDELIDVLPDLKFMIGFEGNGSHTIHGSTTGGNLAVDNDKQVWYCFRHNVGGSKLHWYAIQENIINCEDVNDIDKDQWKEIFDSIRDKYNLPKFQPKKNTINLDLANITYESLRSQILLQKEKQDQYVLIADYFLTNYSIKTNYFTNEIWIYKEGIFEPNGEAFLLSEIHIINPNYSKQARNEIIDKIRISTFFLENIFNKQNIIVTKNKVIDLDLLAKGSNEYIFNFNESYLSTRKLDISYNPGADCPNIKNFLRNVTSYIDKKTKNIVYNEDFEKYLIETIADCLNNHYNSQKAHFFIGEGENGKGTFLRLLEKFLGDKQVSDLGLGQIHENSFQLFILENVMANIVGDSNNKYVRDTGVFKKITGEDSMTVDVKHARKPVQFKNRAKFFLSSQFVPKINEDNHGWYRRIIITKWKFEITDEMRRNFDENSLYTPDELSGLLNEVLQAYINFSDKGFVYLIDSKKSKVEKRTSYLIKSNPVKLFQELYIDENSNTQILTAKLRKCINYWLRKNDEKTIEDRQLGKEIKKILPFITTRQIDGERYYQGIETNQAWEDYKNSFRENKTKQ